MTLQYYSAKAYEHVRTTFNLALPHQAQIRKWYSKIPAGPGFTQPAFDALKAHVEKRKSKNQHVLCALMLDEMAIRKDVSWNGKSFLGYVDLGCDVNDDDSSPVAKNALVLMVVALNESWKVPCRYFLVDSLTGKERANLVSQGIQRLYDINVVAVSLTCDGPSCHFAMLAALGALLKIPDLFPYFPHPSDPKQVAKCYCKIRLHHIAKQTTQAESGLSVRKELSKLVLFKHQ